MEAAHIPNRSVAPTVPLLDRFPWPPSKSFRISERSQWIERAFQIAIQEQLNGKAVDWMEKVSDEQYQAEPTSPRKGTA
jgi:hypothetical protein